MSAPALLHFVQVASGVSATPESGDFVHIPFRALSADIVGSGTWKSTDFRDIEVLKKSVPLLNGIPAYVNHDSWDVRDSVGVIQNARWEESFVDSNGKTIPAGIVVDFVIDTKLYPELVRQLLGAPNATPPIAPSISACSVSISYDFKPSHTFNGGELEDYLFRTNAGSMIDGKEVTRIVTKIFEYREVSLVSFPADKHARTRVGFSKFSAEPEDVRDSYEKDNRYTILMGFSDANEGNSPDSPPPAKTEDLTLEAAQKERDDFAQRNATLEKNLGSSRAMVQAYKSQIEASDRLQIQLQEALQVANANAEAAKVKVEGLELEIASLKERATIGDAAVLDLRADTVRLCRLAAGDDAALIKGINEADYASLKQLHKQYEAQAQAKHPITCKNCGSEYSRQSSEGGVAAADSPEVPNAINQFLENASHI
jgi:hypothetical protein